MKAAAFASIVALAFAGTACSEKAPAETENAASAETAATEAPQFNLRYPGSDTTTASGSSGEFNLRDPGSAEPDAGLRLPEGAINENRLSDIPEIDAPATSAPASEPEDDIIRLD